MPKKKIMALMKPSNTPPKNRKITLRDVAKEAGVSLATTSYVINKQRSFSDETKKRVLDAAKKLQYRANYSAQAMRTGRTKNIGLVIPQLQDPYYPELAKAIENAAHRMGYSVILTDTQQSEKIEKDCALRLIELGVDGIIWCPASEQEAFTKYRKKIPLIAVGRPVEKSKYDTIFSNYRMGASLLADHAISLGHEKIGIISGPSPLLRSQIFLQSLKEGLASRTKIAWELENDFSSELCEKVKSKLSDTDVTMIITGNDLIAIGTIMHLKSLDIQVPAHISVTGFGGTQFSAITSPSLTTIQQPLLRLGEKAVELLMERIEQPDKQATQTIMDVELIHRQSSEKKKTPNNHRKTKAPTNEKK